MNIKIVVTLVMAVMLAFALSGQTHVTLAEISPIIPFCSETGNQQPCMLYRPPIPAESSSPKGSVQQSKEIKETLEVAKVLSQPIFLPTAGGSNPFDSASGLVAVLIGIPLLISGLVMLSRGKKIL